MWRLTSLIYFLVLYQYSIPQPITKESENVRQLRQPDVGECCPCPGSTLGEFDHESATSFGQDMLDGARGVKDCTCRRRLGDAEGASSIFSLNAIGPASNFLRSTESKEDIKPLLHPEVDLASSVLDTLREATDEEYREALARDAVRDAVKIAGLSGPTFKDAVSEESRSIVTIIMNPKEDYNDVIPQASHLQESRCMYGPLGTARLPGKLKATPSLVNDVFDLGKAKLPGSVLLHKKTLDMDNNVGASDVQEHIVNVEEDLMNSRGAGLRPRTSLLKFNPKSPSLINKERKFVSKLPFISHDLKYPLNTGSSLIVPKTGPESSAFENNNNKIEKNDHSVLPKNEQENFLESNLNTPLKEMLSFGNPILKNILGNTGPLNLKHLLKLKDVELLPLDVSYKPTNFIKPKAIFTKSSRENNNLVKNLSDKTEVEFISNTENDQLNSKITPNEMCFTTSKDHQTRNLQTGPNNAFNIEPEVFDSIPNPSNTILRVDEDQASREDSDNHQMSITDELNKRVKDCETDVEYSKIISDYENSKLGALDEDGETDDKYSSRTTNNSKASEQNRNYETDEKNNLRTMNDNDHLTPSCNISVEDNIELKEQQKILPVLNMVPQESSSHKNVENIHNDIVEITTVKYKLHKPLQLDTKTLLSIKADIKNTLKNLKNINSDSNSLSEQNKSTARASYDDVDKTHISDFKIQPEVGSLGEKFELLDCVTENAEQITTFKPTISDNNFEKDGKTCDSVTIQELQKISDKMLQKERISDSKDVACEEKENAIEDKRTENILDNGVNENVESRDSEISANTPNADVILPLYQADETISKGSSDNNIANICKDYLSRAMPTSLNQIIYPETIKSDRKGATDINSDASNVVINKLSWEKIPLLKSLENNNPFSVLEAPFLEGRNVLKQDALPTLNDIKFKHSNIFNTNERDAQEELSQEKYCLGTSSSALKTNMETDASTPYFQVKQPRKLINEENLNIFQSVPTFKSPTVGLNLHKTNLIPEDSIFKTIKLQPLLGSTDDVLGLKSVFPNNIYATPKVSDVFDDIIVKLPSFDDLKDKMRLNTQNLLNTPSFLENFNDKLDLSDFKHNAENSIKNIQQKLKSARNDYNFIHPMEGSHNLLDVIAERHEDLGDKLRAVHIDLNDRLQSMQNNLINPTYLNNDRRKTNTNSFNNSNKSNNQQLFNSRTPAQVPNRKESLLRPGTQRKVKPIPSQAIDTRNFKMKSAASIPIPKTVEVPKLKETSIKSTTPMIKDAPIFKSNIPTMEPPLVRASPIFVKETIKKLQNTSRQLGVKQVNPFKNSKVKVSFSTTPRPSPSLAPKPGLMSTAIPISRQKITIQEDAITKFGDPSGALSETIPSILTPETNINSPLSTHLDEINTLKEQRKPNLLQNWPKTTEGSFLAKVKEAVNARLPKVKMANKLDGELRKPLVDNKMKDHPFVSETQIALDDLQIIREAPLKDNFSYKCRMVCTQE